MARYVDGVVVSVPKKNLGAYRRMSHKVGKVWREHGALEYIECGRRRQAREMDFVSEKREAEARRNRGLRIHRLQVTQAARPHQRTGDEGPTPLKDDGSEGPMPFDTKRKFWGGFKTIISI